MGEGDAGSNVGDGDGDTTGAVADGDGDTTGVVGVGEGVAVGDCDGDEVENHPQPAISINNSTHMLVCPNFFNGSTSGFRNKFDVGTALHRHRSWRLLL